MSKSFRILPDGQDFGNDASHFPRSFGFSGSAQGAQGQKPSLPVPVPKPKPPMPTRRAAAPSRPPAKPPAQERLPNGGYAEGGAVGRGAGIPSMSGSAVGNNKGSAPSGIIGALGQALGTMAGRDIAQKLTGRAPPAPGQQQPAGAFPGAPQPQRLGMTQPGFAAPMRKGGAVKNFIQSAVKKPGALHADLNVPQGKPIPPAMLASAAKEPGKIGQRARFAQTLKALPGKKG